MRLAAIVVCLALFSAPLAQAQPYEFLACNFVEGKGMADLDKWIADFTKVANKMENRRYTATILTAQFAEEDQPDFFWMGMWPDAAMMGASLKEYFEDGAGAEIETAFGEIAVCRGNSLWWGRQVYEGK